MTGKPTEPLLTLTRWIGPIVISGLAVFWLLVSWTSVWLAALRAEKSAHWTERSRRFVEAANALSLTNFGFFGATFMSYWLFFKFPSAVPAEWLLAGVLVLGAVASSRFNTMFWQRFAGYNLRSGSWTFMLFKRFVQLCSIVFVYLVASANSMASLGLAFVLAVFLGTIPLIGTSIASRTGHYQAAPPEWADIAKRAGLDPQQIRRVALDAPDAFALPSGDIGLTDSIVEKLEQAELDAVIRHEVGHHQHLASWFPIVASVSVGRLAAFGLGLRFLSVSDFSSRVVSLFLFAASVAIEMLANRKSRKNERDADRHATATDETSADFGRALERLAVLANMPVVHRGGSHPATYDRMVASGYEPDYPKPAPLTGAMGLSLLGLTFATFLTLAALITPVLSIFGPRVEAASIVGLGQPIRTAPLDQAIDDYVLPDPSDSYPPEPPAFREQWNSQGVRYVDSPTAELTAAMAEILDALDCEYHHNITEGREMAPFEIPDHMDQWPPPRVKIQIWSITFCEGIS